MLRCAIVLPAILCLPACTGGVVAGFMPGTAIDVDGHPFVVTQTARGATVRNFETGRTSPDVLLNNAALAAQRVTGCNVSSIAKQGNANTYFATIICPDA